MVPITIDEVRIWYSTCESLADGFIASKQSLLSVEEQQQWQKFRYQIDRDRYLITRVMSREIIGQYLQVEPSAVRFRRSTSGKPALANGIYSNHLEFNITHCEGLIALAVAHNPIGIDAERKDRKIELDVGRLVLTQTEQDEIQEWPIEKRRNRLLQYWTMKEALVKAIGVGFSQPLNTFGVKFSPQNEPQIYFPSAEPSRLGIWFAYQTADLFADHIFSLAMKCPDHSEPKLSFHCWSANA
jgi:4'-phosphopantetheinyl transferase